MPFSLHDQRIFYHIFYYLFLVNPNVSNVTSRNVFSPGGLGPDIEAWVYGHQFILTNETEASAAKVGVVPRVEGVWLCVHPLSQAAHHTEY